MVVDSLSSVFTERFADPTTGRTALILRWDRGWSSVSAELPTGRLPDVTDLALFEGAGLAVPSPAGELVVRIDRSGHRPCFAVTVGGRRMISLPDDRLTPQAAAELAAANQPVSGSSGRALALWVGALAAAFVVVTVGVIGVTRWSKDESTTSAPPTAGFTVPPVPLTISPVPLSPGAAPSTAFGTNLVDSYVFNKVVELGATEPDKAAACITTMNVITEVDVLEMRAPFRSSLYQCMPDELSQRWLVSATGLLPADEPCARRASVVGLGRLTLDELTLLGPTSNSTQYPADIQDKLVAVVKELCPQIPPDVAERVVKE